MIEYTSADAPTPSIEHETQMLLRTIRDMGQIAVDSLSDAHTLARLQDFGIQVVRLAARLELQLELSAEPAAKTESVDVTDITEIKATEDAPSSPIPAETAMVATEPSDGEVVIDPNTFDDFSAFPKPEHLPKVMPNPNDPITTVVFMRDDLLVVNGEQMPVTRSKRFALIKLMINRDRDRTSRDLQKGFGGDAHTEAQRFSTLLSVTRRKWRELTGTELTIGGLRYRMNPNITLIDKRDEIAKLPSERLRARERTRTESPRTKGMAPSQSLARLGLSSLSGSTATSQKAPATQAQAGATANGKAADAVKAIPAAPRPSNVSHSPALLRGEKIGSSPLGDWNSAEVIAEHINFLHPSEHPVNALLVKDIISSDVKVDDRHVRLVEGQPLYTRQQSFTIARTVRRILSA